MSRNKQIAHSPCWWFASLFALCSSGMAAAGSGTPAAAGLEASIPLHADPQPPFFVASLQWRPTPDQAPGHVCTGSLLSPVVVVTAAQCVAGLVESGDDGTRLSVVIGRLDLADAGHGVERHPLRRSDGSARIFLHPRFAEMGEGRRFDVAVIQLDAPVDVDVRPVLSAAAEPPGTLWTVAGWGSQDTTLHSDQVRLLDQARCGESGGDGGHEATRLCAEAVQWLEPCAGGRGSPLFASLPGLRRPLQIGMASAGPGCALEKASTHVRLGDPDIRAFLRRYVAL